MPRHVRRRCTAHGIHPSSCYDEPTMSMCSTKHTATKTVTTPTTCSTAIDFQRLNRVLPSQCEHPQQVGHCHKKQHVGSHTRVRAWAGGTCSPRSASMCCPLVRACVRVCVFVRFLALRGCWGWLVGRLEEHHTTTTPSAFPQTVRVIS